MGFPEPKQAIWEAPEVALFGSVGGRFLGREYNRADARFGSDDGCFPGRDGLCDLMCLDEYYCIRPVLVPLLRRHSPYLKHCLCIGLLLYKTGISTTTQEVLSMALGAK